ncbi:MAG: hypothetical protein H7A33_02345 [Deltaproteobacteria bacterium]|nr:hypothetical protein [Deltaproteobacteria bacterium]
MTTFQDSKIAIGVPIGSEHVHWRFMTSLVELTKPPRHGLIIRQGSLVDAARNEIVKMMLDHPAGFTHLFFIDDDMTFPQNTLQRLIEMDVPVASSLCFSRVPPFRACVFEREDQGKKGFWKRVDFKNEGSKMEVDGTGTGCMLIKREVLEQIQAPHFAIEWDNGNQRGEDLYFMEKLYQAGIPVTLDTTLKIGHMTSATVERAPEQDKAHVKL